jgi:putative transposase
VNADPDKVVMDKSGANKAAIKAVNAGRAVQILVRQVKYLNDIVEQDHRAIKRLTRPMLTSNHSAPPAPCSPASS